METTTKRGIFDQIDQASSAIAYQPLRPGVSLAFKVRFIGVQEAARLGVLIQTLQQLIGRYRQPDEADLTGLEAAELEAAQRSDEEQRQQIDQIIGRSMQVAKSVITHVQDFDDPTHWVPVVWVDSPDEEGDGDGVVRLLADRVIRSDGLANVLQATLAPATEVAQHWAPFPV
jgi:hypothetical protein